APDAPGHYTVQKGDTLWDISAKFLTDPWYWPEIWHINPQVANPHLIYPGDVLALTWVEGQPQVMVETGGPIRMSPRVRESPLSEAINAIPYERIAAFMSRPEVLAKEQVKAAPYVAHGRDDRLITAEGNEVYVRRLGNSQPGGRYNIYHVGDELKDPDDGDVLGYQGLFTGQGSIKRSGDPATMFIASSARETLDGDILLPENVEMRMDFIPRAPKSNIEGTVMSVIDQRTVVAEYDILIINRGKRDGLEPGSVLATWAAGEKVRDTTANAESGSVQLPNERTGLFMVFKTYDRMSYGLMLESEREINVGDKVRSP
ncbi:MAG: LysM peptidoglycan-binding domain-containing protein, partial [Gammaproteobacteria bacterium]|nr:LysM peptidoglycan-binding domain-containing protein [Gammaproteobacteria bacterium]